MESIDDNFGKFEFQDFIHTTPQANVAELDVETSVKEKASVSYDLEGVSSGSKTGDGTDGAPQAGPLFWSFDYYKQFFDVNTNQIVERITNSMIPRKDTSFLDTCIKPKADLYGPFWICVTLVFTTAVSRNMASYLQFVGDKDYHWKYQFHTVSYAATAIFLYAWLLPVLVWGAMWWQGGQTRISMLETLCVYGYSLAIFVPTSVLWVIQFSWLQWAILIVAVGLSGAVLVSSIWPAAQDASRAMALPLTVVVIGLHVLMAVGFMIFFFHATSSQLPLPTTVHDLVTKSIKNSTVAA